MNDPNFKEKRLIFFLVIAVAIIFCTYKFFWTQDVEKVGIYSKGLVVNSESTKGGILITVQYSYRGGLYKTSLGSDLGKGSIGRQYFIQLKPEDPRSIVFHRDKPVPDCLTNVEVPSSGWDKIPGCP
jgi:hypothetical protein